MREFICGECLYMWRLKRDPLGDPRCPECDGVGSNPLDFGDFACPMCGHEWRAWGNGGLTLGMVPECPRCGCGLTNIVT